MDDYSDKCMMQFSPAKKHMTQFVEQAFIAFKGPQGKPIKYVRMYGGGENEGVKKLLCLKNGAMLEKTPPYMPQYNGKIEQRFAVLMSLPCFGMQICKDR